MSSRRYWSFLVSRFGTISMPSDMDEDGSMFRIETGDSANDERSSSLTTRLLSPLIVGLDRPDRAVASASSFRNVSNSRSNLNIYYTRKKGEMLQYALATENFNVETPTVPYAHSKYEYEEGATPKWAVIEEENRWQFGKNAIHWVSH